MDAPREDDVLLLKDENFDFEISLSSSSTNEDDDDEVFFGPVGHRERCIAARVELTRQAPEEPAPPAPADGWSWSPLAGDAFVEVYKEAHLLALQIESARKAASAPPAPPCPLDGEHFLQEPGSKLSLFDQERGAPRSPQSLKRETFCVGDGAGLLPVPPAAPVGSAPGHPPSQVVAQKRGVSRLLPRAAPPRHANLEKPSKEPPASPSQMGPPGDPCSRDGSSLPASGPQPGPGKRSLPIPHKGLRKTLLRPPGGTGLARKLSTSGTPSTSGPMSTSGPPSSRPCGVHTFRAVAGPDAGQLLAAPGRARPSVRSGPPRGQGQGAPELVTEPPRTPRTTATHPQTPEPAARAPASRRSLSCSSQAPRTGGARRRESSLGPRIGASSTLAEPFKVPRSPAGEPPGSVTPQFPRVQRPQPHTPAGRAPLHSTPAPCGGPSSARTPAATRRLSSLPTPASRRLSSLPRATPRTTHRPSASPPCASARPLSSEPQRTGPLRTAWEGSSHVKSSGSDASPDGSLSPPAAVPQALRFSPEQSERVSPPTGDTSEALLVDIRLDQLASAPTVGSAPMAEVPLIDFCSTPEAHAALGCENRPLIDLLVNTPEWIRGNTPKPKPGPDALQLIDLASPLIQLSPEADKENMASPLLKF